MSFWLHKYIFFTYKKHPLEMVTTTSLRAAKKFNLAYFVLEQLEIHHWTEQKLVDEMNISENKLTSILLGEKRLTPGLAQRLSELFGPSSQFWINIDNGYRQWINV
jgi:plasmid maintenance system antidote protein VapI